MLSIYHVLLYLFFIRVRFIFFLSTFCFFRSEISQFLMPLLIYHRKLNAFENFFLFKKLNINTIVLSFFYLWMLDIVSLMCISLNSVLLNFFLLKCCTLWHPYCTWTHIIWKLLWCFYIPTPWAQILPFLSVVISQLISCEKTTSSFTRNVNKNPLSLKKWHYCSLPHLLTRWPAVCWHLTCFGFEVSFI